MAAGSERSIASHISIAFLALQIAFPEQLHIYLAYDSAWPILSYISMIFRFLRRTMTNITRKRAAIPSRAGTTAMIQVGAATQLDSTSQKTVPKKLRQHPPLQKLGSEHPVLIFLNYYYNFCRKGKLYSAHLSDIPFHHSILTFFLSFSCVVANSSIIVIYTIKAMINIFQYLKQGTSLNRNSHNSNQQLEDHIIAKARTINHTYQSTGKFHNSDSEDQAEPDTLDEKELQHHSLKRERLNHEFVKGHHIRVEGTDLPRALSNFTKIIQKYQLKDSLIDGIGELGYERPTAVQMQVIPALIEKRNVIVTAPTGTGKTLAFLIPLLQNLQPSKKITAIIMVPLQELATQIFEVLKKLGKGSSITFQCLSKITAEEKHKIENKKSPGFNILVATPITFLKRFSDKKVLLKNVEYIVLDQCDKCFQESFFEQMKSFLDLFLKYHPTYALFSATIQNAVEEILKIYLHDCVRIEVGGKNKVLDKIEQSIEYCTNQLGKLIYVKNLITEGKLVPPVLMFVQEKVRAKQLYFQLNKYLKQQMHQGKRIQVLSADKSWEEREKIVREFDAGKYWILVTTDILARGIDFTNVNLVINYDFPNSMLAYIHRVGRTGRAERTGTAVTLFTDQDKPLVRSLANLLITSGCRLPDWIAEMPKANKQLRKKLEKYPVRRLPVGRAEGKDKGWQKEIEVLEKRWQKLKKKQIQKAEKEKKPDDDGWVQVGPQDE